MSMVRDDLLRGGVDVLPDAQIGGTAPGVIGRMGAALILRQLQQRSVPSVGSQSRGGVDGNAKIIADLGTGYALQLIFVESRSPFSGRIALGENRNTQYPCGQQEKGNSRSRAVDLHSK